MATESVIDRALNGPGLNDAQECISKARGIAEMIGPYAISTLGYESAQPLANAMWALSDQLDKLAELVRLDPVPEAQA